MRWRAGSAANAPFVSLFRAAIVGRYAVRNPGATAIVASRMFSDVTRTSRFPPATELLTGLLPAFFVRAPCF